MKTRKKKRPEKYKSNGIFAERGRAYGKVRKKR